MDAAERFMLLDSLFSQARDLPDDALRTFIAEVKDPSVRAELSEMVLQDRAGTPTIRTLMDVGIALDEVAEPPAIPESIGGYAVLGVVGEGASGIVLRARQPETDRVVAVKVLATGTWNPKALARFRREVRLLGRLEHPGIARVYGAGTDTAQTPARPYFVMEFVDGVPLTAWVRRNDVGTLGVVRLFRLIAEAVAHAHACGVVHRDLKPANVLVDGTGQPKVLDFGVAGLADPGADDDGTSPPSLRSVTGDLVGTVPYMAPEQFGGARVADARSDLYAIGVMMFEALAGRMPYAVDRRNVVEAAEIVRDEVPTSLGRVDPSLSGDVETVVAKLLEKEPARRYQSARELADDLQRILDGQPTLARPVSRGERAVRFARRHRTLIATVMAAFVALASLLAWTAHLWRVAEQRGDTLQRTLEARSRDDYRRAVGFAEASLRAGNVSDARAALESAEPERRGWEWDFLSRRASGELRCVPIGSLPAAVGSAAGRMAVVDNATGSVWALAASGDAPTRVLVRRGQVRDVALSPDGTEMIVAGGESGVTVHRASDGAALRDFKTGIGPATRAAWSPDGRLLACAGVDGALAVLDARSGAIALRVEATEGRPYQAEGLVAFLPGSDGVVRAVKTEPELMVCPIDGAPIRVPVPDGRVESLATCAMPDGSILVLAGTIEGAVHRFDARTGASRGVITAHSGGVRAIAAGPRPGLFATGGADAAIHCWDAVTGARIGTAVGSERAVHGLAIDAGKGTLAAVGHDGNLRIWDIDSYVLEPALSGHRAWVYGVTFLPDGSLASCAGEAPDRDGRVIRWDARHARPLESIEVGGIGAPTLVRDVADDGAGHPVAAYWLARGGGIVFLEPGRERSVRIESGAPCSVAGLPGGEAVAWRRLNSSAIEVMSRSGAALQEILLPGSTRGRMPVRVRADGSELITATDSGLAVIALDGTRMAGLRTVPLDGQVSDIAISRADRLVAVGFLDGSAALIDPDAEPDAAVRWRTDRSHAADICVARTPDGSRVAVASDRLIRICDAADGKPLLNLAGHGDIVLSLAFDAGGNTLASGSIDRTIRLWKTSAER
jgi:WD40 repeat protein